MRFTVDPELELFAESVRGAIGELGGAARAGLRRLAGRPRRCARRTARRGWLGELWADPALLGPAVAGGIELGRAVAPLCLVDDATLGGPLAIDGRVRHGEGRVEGGEREPTLDGTGTLRGVAAVAAPDPERLPRVGRRHARLPRGPRRRRAREGGRACALARAVRRAARDASGRAGPPRRRGARPRRPRALRLGRSRAGRRLPGGDARLGRRRLPRGDRARAADPRRHRLRARGRHPPLLPAGEERAGVGGRAACARARPRPAPDSWGAIVTDPLEWTTGAARRLPL